MILILRPLTSGIFQNIVETSGIFQKILEGYSSKTPPGTLRLQPLSLTTPNTYTLDLNAPKDPMTLTLVPYDQP